MECIPHVAWRNILEWAIGEKISYVELASLLGVKLSTILSYNKSAHNLTLEKLTNLSEVIDTNISYFIPITDSQRDVLSKMKTKTPSDNKMMKGFKIKKVPIYQKIWRNIREWAMRENISEAGLASLLGVDLRTLSSYDESAHNLTLEKLTNLSEVTDINISYFIPFTESQLAALSKIRTNSDNIIDDKYIAMKRFNWI